MCQSSQKYVKAHLKREKNRKNLLKCRCNSLGVPFNVGQFSAKMRDLRGKNGQDQYFFFFFKEDPPTKKKNPAYFGLSL